MSATQTKRKITLAMLSFAGATAVVALCLAAVGGSQKRPNQPPRTAVATPPTTPTVAPPTIPDTQPVPQKPPVAQKPAQPQVDVVFVLDTTGSMGGLLAGAKRKIWAIATQILSGQPKPDVRIGLVGYRDKGDDYVTRRYPLTEEVDDVYAQLRSFQASGGGDTPEHVNRALADAIRRMQWREGQNVLRQIYLVGDAPPHEGLDGLTSTGLAREASKKGIIINAVRCGTAEDTQVAWKQIALASGGIFASLQQDGGMLAMATPLDTRLAELNRELTRTVLPTGGDGDKEAARRRASENLAMDAVAQADNAAFRVGRGAIDGKDLLTVMTTKNKKLSEMKDDELPAPVAALPPTEREAYVRKVAHRREELKAEIGRLSTARASYLRAKRPASSAPSFDDTVGHALKAQGAKAGLVY